MESALRRSTYASLAFFIIIGFTLIRYYFSSYFPLTPDETNYWQWGRHLAWGYHDQAPMIGWLINLSTRYLGHTEQAVRLPNVIMGSIASYYMVLLALRWFGSRIAFHTSILSQGILIFFVGGVLATADATQAAGWAGATYHIAFAYENNRWRNWLLGGFWFGIGILGKFSMGIFLPCAFLYGLFSGEHRPRLAGIKPYAGVSLGLAMFAPVIVWNALNGWNSLRHVAYLGGVNEKAGIKIGLMLEYLGSEALLLTPMVFILCIMAWWKSVSGKKHRANLRIRYLFFTSFPMFAFFLILSLHSRVYGNWPAPAYLTATILIALFFHPETKLKKITSTDIVQESAELKNITDNTELNAPEIGENETPNPANDSLNQTNTSNPVNEPETKKGEDEKERSRDLWHYGLVSAYLITAIVAVQTAWQVFPIPGKLDRSARETTGWKELGLNVDTIRKSMPNPSNTFIFGFRYQIASELAFYTPGQPETVSINRWNRPNVYDYWFTDDELRTKDAVGVTDRDPQGYLTKLNSVFDRVEQPVELKIVKKGKEIQSFYIFKAYGFKGGLRWEPPNKDDIRSTK